MKKFILFFLLIVPAFTSCRPEPLPPPLPPDKPYEEQEQPVTPPPQDPQNQNYYPITDLWQISMRREIPYPFKVYVLKLADKRLFYLRRLNFDGELHIGDEVAYSYYINIPDEISSIDGIRYHGGADAKENAMQPTLGTYLVASDPIEADVKNMFALNMRYALPFVAVETVLIETTAGNLIYVKKSKLAETDSEDLTIGDRDNVSWNIC